MGIFSWIVVGGLAGWLGSKIMGINRYTGFISNIVIGIIGAFVGGFAFSLIGGKGVTGVNLWSIIVAMIGSIIFIWIVRKVKK